MNFLTIQPDHITPLPAGEGVPERCHQFDAMSIKAVNAAIAAKRPLLLRGEPGVGKTQLAAAVAVELQRGFLSYTVDSRTEARDLQYRFDAVARLADAQVLGHNTASKPHEIREELAVAKYLRPGPLWWAFDWKSIEEGQTETDTPFALEHNDRMRSSGALDKNGWLVLVDEIDKAETDVPNGLLEALGMSQFQPQGRSTPVTVTGPAPLVIITTNEERVLPDAFIRRCLVLHLALPGNEELKPHLVKRGQAHFGGQTEDSVLERAAQLLVADRQAAIRQQLSPLPGQAEYLDLVRAVIELANHDRSKSQREWVDEIACYALKKHSELHHDSPMRE